MRGGSRFGAGRPGWNGKVESLLHIDVQQWRADDLLVPNTFFGWYWSRDNKEIASIGCRVISRDRLILEYTWKPDGGASQTVQEPVRLTYTACHYGGTRVWFCCPACGRRVRKLYSVRGSWYCRNSLNVAYSTQSLDVIQRMHRRISKLENRLEENGAKPKGMHWKTYDRIMKKREDTQRRLDYAFCLAAERILDCPDFV